MIFVALLSLLKGDFLVLKQTWMNASCHRVKMAPASIPSVASSVHASQDRSLTSLVFLAQVSTFHSFLSVNAIALDRFHLIRNNEGTEIR